MKRNTPIDVVVATCSRVFSSIAATYSSQMKKDVGQKKFTVSVEGNIGSGKTSLLQHFVDSPNTEVQQEPVSKWRNMQGHNLLAMMYEDPSRWALTFQTYVQLTMLETHTKPQEKPVKLMERSIYSAKYCFVENLYKNGQMPDFEYMVLTKWFDWIVQNEDCKLDLIVYLQTKPETCHERIKQRCRKEESTIPLDYLRTLHEFHENWLIKQTQFALPAPILVLDGNSDLPEMLKLYDAHRNEILCGCS